MTYNQTLMEVEERGKFEGELQGKINTAKDMIKANLVTFAAIKESGLYSEKELEAILAP